MEAITIGYIIIALVALAIGFLATYFLLNKKTTEAENSLAVKQQEIERLNKEFQSMLQKHEELEDLYQQLKVDNGKLETENKSNIEQKQNYKEDLAGAEDNLSKAVEAQHDAENKLTEANAKLESAHKQQQDLQERLVIANNELKEEREKLEQQVSQNSKLDNKAKEFEVKAEQSNKNCSQIKEQLSALQTKYDTLNEKYTSLSNEHSELNASQEERENSHSREVANFEKQKASLVEQFKVLSNEILDAKTKSLQENSKLTLASVMNPFQQSIDNFKKEVQEIHHRESTQQGELRKELESLKELNQKITNEAHELSTALRGQKKLQGNWGELVLENVLDRSGLQIGKDYKREVSITTEEGRQRPDALVYLPQGKHLVIDAKVSLNAYTRFVNAEDEAERTVAIKEHVQAVANRIKELADKDYYKLPGLNSPEMVFMFIPIESAFVEALKADETLFQQAIENHVLVATPTTLLTSLNIVKQLWRYEDQNKHTAALANEAEAVFKKLSTFLRSFEGIKKGLDNAASAYSKAEGQLISGNGNLVKRVGEFKNLAPAIKAELPSYFVDKAALEIDFVSADSEPKDAAENQSQIEETLDELEVETN